MVLVVEQLKRAPQQSYLAGCCFIVTGLNKSIPVELNESFIGCNLAKGRSLTFGWMFFILFLWQIMHILPPCFINDLPFKIQYILLMFTRIYSGPRCPYLLQFLTIKVVTCLAGKIISYFHSYGIFAHFSMPPTLITPLSSRNGLNSFNLSFFYFFIVE